MWHQPRGYVSNFLMRLASSCGVPGRSGTPSRQSRGIDPPVAIRRGEGAQRSCAWNLGVPIEGDRYVGELLGCIKCTKYRIKLQDGMCAFS